MKKAKDFLNQLCAYIPLNEYADTNHDKQLSLSTYTEGQPVVISSDYAPLANRHGKVISHGAAAGTVKVKFDDQEYDVPEHHVTRRDAVANESMDLSAKITHKKHVKHTDKDKIMSDITEEHKCLALLENAQLKHVIVNNIDESYQKVEEHFGIPALAIFPIELPNIVESTDTDLSEMTQEQKDKREQIVWGLKKNKKELQKRYGDRWESVMYAIATKKAMQESLSESREIIYKKKMPNKTILMVKDGEYYTVEQRDRHGDLIDSNEFSYAGDAEKFIRENLV